MITALTVDNLALERGERRLFEAFSLRLQAGEAVALTGGNGAGKSSLLRAVAGLLRPSEGEIRFESDGGAIDPDAARSGGLHLLGHQDGLKTTRTGGDELGFWSGWTGGNAAGQARSVAALDLAPLLGLEVRKLSAGQRRRLALGRLLASPRALWLLDEPLAPLDAARRASFGELMREHLDTGGLILAAVHDPLPVVAREVALG